MSDPFASGLLERLPARPRKVAIVRATRVGDFILATPAFRALRAALPTAEIAFIGLPFVRDLVARSRHLDRFEEFPGYPGLAEQFFDARKAGRFFERMQAERFDLAIQMHGSGVCANPFTLMLGARWTSGFMRQGDGAGRLDAALPIPEAGHEVRRFLALTTFLGAPAQGEEMEFPLRPEDHATAEALLSKAEPPLIGLHPAARDRTKRWSPERFRAVGAELRRAHGGTPVLVGGPEERRLADGLALRLGRPCVNLAGRTTLPVLGAVIARLALLLTNDSGPAHIAYALGVPTVTVFGATDAGRWGPPAVRRHRVLASPVPCRPCDYLDGCPLGMACLEAVTVRQVVRAAGEALTEQTR